MNVQIFKVSSFKRIVLIIVKVLHQNKSLSEIIAKNKKQRALNHKTQIQNKSYTQLIGTYVKSILIFGRLDFIYQKCKVSKKI